MTAKQLIDILDKLKEHIRITDINNDMANSIFIEIYDLLKQYPCMHLQHGYTPPPMFYAEWIQCVINKARVQGIEAGLKYTMDMIRYDEILKWDYPLNIDSAKKIWDYYLKQTKQEGLIPNEKVEGTTQNRNNRK